jgi:hypothetical protein
VRGVGETGRTNSGCGGDDGRVRWWRRQVALVLRFAQDDKLLTMTNLLGMTSLLSMTSLIG